MVPHHIGYLVKSIEKSLPEFLSLGYQPESETVYDPYRDINICFLINDGLRVELVSPASSESVVSDLFKKYGSTPYHICYQVDNLEETEKVLRSRGYLPTYKKKPAPAIGNVNAAFYFNKRIGILELISVS